MKKIGTLLLAGAAALALTACTGKSAQELSSSGQTGVTDTQADKGMEVMGDCVTYDPNHLVNNGFLWTGGSGPQKIPSRPLPRLMRRSIQMYPYR